MIRKPEQKLITTPTSIKYKFHSDISPDENSTPFFSLVVYKNNYFISKNYDDIVEFYKSFENSEQLIRWMKERPTGISQLHEIEGNKEIIIVIPTSDFEGKYAKSCREEIFLGHHIIFVESGGKEDFYFNIAHNFNVGFKRALEYNPKWVIYSNDDMYKIDNSEKLTNELKKLNHKEIMMVFSREASIYHSAHGFLVRRRVFRNVAFFFVNKYKRFVAYIEKKFNVNYFIFSELNFLGKILYKKIEAIRLGIDFCIISGEYIKSKNGKVMDEVYINHLDDSDLSLQFFQQNFVVAEIDYKIGDFIGSTLGTGPHRMLRSIASEVYFNNKWKLKS